MNFHQTNNNEGNVNTLTYEQLVAFWNEIKHLKRESMPLEEWVNPRYYSIAECFTIVNVLYSKGVITLNECRRIMGLTPINGGDVLISPINETTDQNKE